MKTCPECGSKKIEMKNSEVLCKDCGLVIGEVNYSGGRVV